MTEPSRTALQARLTALLTEPDELINAALVLRGRALEVEYLLLAGNGTGNLVEENTAIQEG